MTTDGLSDRSARRRIRARHTKSRKGCFTCKGRRVKCDEIKPICGACALRGEPCNWPATTGSQGPDTPDWSQADSDQTGRAKAPQDQSKRRAAHPGSGSPHPLQFDIASDAAGGRSTPLPGELNMVDLQLHSHFMLHTCKHMSLNPRRQHIWETVIPRFAMRNEALMHLLLALAGLDYASDRTTDQQPAHTSPDMERQPSSTIADHDHDHDQNHTLDAAYLQVIIEHHQRGLESFRTELANLSSTNLNLVFAGSMLLVGFALASLRIRNLNDAHSPPGQPRLDWIFLIQGLCTVITHNWPELRMGPLRDLTDYSHANDDWRLCPRDALRSMSSIRRGCSPRLVAFCRGADEALAQLVGYHASLAAREGQILAEQKAALELLEGMYMRTLYVVHFSSEARESPLDVQADLEDAALMAWAEFLPPGFLDTLAGGGVYSTLSYVILAYFHLLFTLFESFWYVKGGFDGEIVKIKALVDMSGEAELMSLMQWPVSVIAVYPT
ncbi:hypothetical protein IFM62136_03190 [Aspergillus lentulus]|nr:hypothetical protein IFM62136_03190 [Aspergillus lentulus]